MIWRLIATIFVAFTTTLTTWSFAQTSDINVFAASSLRESFTELAKVFERINRTRVNLSFAGSQILRTQIEAGASADVFASADEVQYLPLVQQAIFEPGILFVRNQLVLITSLQSNVHSIADLVRPGIRLVLGSASVPAGTYAREALANLSSQARYGPRFSERVLQNLVSEEPNVRSVLLKVSLGEADAGIVYVTDITPETRGRVREIAVFSLPTARYFIGSRRNASRAAHAFVDFVRSRAGQVILARWRFLPAKL